MLQLTKPQRICVNSVLANTQQFTRIVSGFLLVQK